MYSEQSRFLQSKSQVFTLQSTQDKDGSSLSLQVRKGFVASGSWGLVILNTAIAVPPILTQIYPQCCRFKATGVQAGIEVVFLTGWNESYIKYWELFKDLTEAGFSVTTMDHRSQGLSGRVYEPFAMSFVYDFDSYVADAEQLVHAIKSR